MVKDMTGLRFGRLTVIKRAGSTNSGIACWECQCDCGNTTIVRGSSLRNGTTTSCGCFMRSKGVRKNFNQIKFNCEYCGKESFDKPSHYRRKSHHFCSTECYAKYVSELPFYMTNSYKGVRKIGESKQVYHRNYCKKHPDTISHLKSRRYAAERGAKGSHTKQEWENLKKLFNNRCAICGQVKPLTKDHVIPLSKGGTDYISNIQPLCRNCNSKKNNKLDYHLNTSVSFS